MTSLPIMKSQQRTNYFVQFCQQVWTICGKQKKQWIILTEQREMIWAVFWHYPRCSSSPWSEVPRVMYSIVLAPRGRKPSFASWLSWPWVHRAGNDLSPSIEVDDVPVLWREDSKAPGDSHGHILKYTSMSSAGSGTVSAPGQEASADHPSSEPRCPKTMVASEWVERPRSSSAALGRPWWRSILGERSCSSQPSTWWTPVLPTGLPRRSRNGECLWSGADGRSQIYRCFQTVPPSPNAHPTQHPDRSQTTGTSCPENVMQDLSVNFVQHLLPSYPHELCLEWGYFESVPPPYLCIEKMITVNKQQVANTLSEGILNLSHLVINA